MAIRLQELYQICFVGVSEVHFALSLFLPSITGVLEPFLFCGRLLIHSPSASSQFFSILPSKIIDRL